MEGRISLFDRGLREEKGQTYLYMLSAKQESIMYYFYNVFGIAGSNQRPAAHRVNALPLSHRSTLSLC